MAVVIVVSEGTARAPSPGVANSGRRSHIAERAVAVVVVEDAATYIGDVDVFPAVIVVVADAHTHAPSAMVQARLCSNIGEGAVAVIVIELAGRTSAAPQIFQSGPIHEKNIQPAIVVVVQEGDPTTH